MNIQPIAVVTVAFEPLSPTDFECAEQVQKDREEVLRRLRELAQEYFVRIEVA